MDIIPQIVDFIITNWESIFSPVDESTTFLDLVQEIHEFASKLGCSTAERILQIVDEEIYNHSNRKNNWYVVRKNDKRTISTIMGEVTYTRTYYRNKKDNAYAYLCDEWLGIPKHERTDLTLKAAILRKAADMSYQKTIDSFPHVGITSKTTVMNIIRRVGLIENDAVPVSTEKRPVKTVYIEADEDHLAMQHGEGKLGKMVYVHEGLEVVSRKRKKLIETRYFTGVNKSNDELWLQVADYLDKVYDENSLARIYLSGDGAVWIREGLKWIRGAEFVLDGYHLSKYITQAAGSDKDTERELREYTAKNFKKEAAKLFRVLSEKAEDEKARERIRSAGSYILRHWEAIQRQKEADYIGCSAESHVSHVLAARMSSRPMAWSAVGAEHMAGLRTFIFNGGNMTNYLKEKDKNVKKGLRLAKLENKMKKRMKEWCQVSLPVIANGKVSPTYIWLKGISSI